MRRPAIASLLFLLLLAGCSRPTASGDGTTITESSPAGAKLKVVYIPKDTGNPYFADVVNGFKEGCDKLGCEFSTVGPAKADATSQIPFIKEQVQRRVDVIAISANSPDALVPALDEARAKGIIVVTVDADLVGSEAHRDAAVLPTDFSKVGASQVELLGSKIGYQGDIAILSATRDAPNQKVWVADMLKTLLTPKYAKMKLVEVAYGDDEAQKSTTETEALLTKHPGLRGIISPTSVGVAAAARAIQVAGVFPGGPHATGPGLALIGLSTPNQMKPFVEGGVVPGFQLWSPHDEGLLACYLGVGLKGGKIKASEGTEFDAGTLGKHKFEAKNVVNTGPLVTFDKANIAKYNF